jgi:hypothetical protein
MIDPNSTKQEHQGKMMNVVNVAKVYNRTKARNPKKCDSLPINHSNNKYQEKFSFQKKADQPEEVALGKSTLEYIENKLAKPINKQVNNTIVSEKSIKNISLLKNLSKLKTYNSRNLSTLHDFSQNFSINIDNNMAQNLLITYQNFNTSENNESCLPTTRNVFFNTHKIIIVYRLNSHYLIPMQILNEDSKSVTLKHVIESLYSLNLILLMRV